MPNEHVFKLFTLAFIAMNFMGILFKISKWQSTMIDDIKIFDIGFDLSLDLGLRGFISG